MAVVEVDDGRFLPVFEPVVAGDLAVVFIHFPVALFPGVKLARPQPQPGEQGLGGQLGAVRPVADVIHDLVARVMGNPASVQSSPLGFFCLDVLLHQFGDDFVLVGQLGLELLDAAVLGLLDAAIATVLDGSLEGLVGLGQDSVDPGMNLTRLQAKLFGKGRNRFLSSKMPANDLGLLLGGETTTGTTHGISPVRLY